MSDIQTDEWLVKIDGSVVARFPEELLADLFAAGIRETEKIKGFDVYVDVVCDFGDSA